MNLLCKKRKEKKENHLQPQKQGKSGDVEVSLGPEQSHHGQVCSVGVVFKIHFICGGSILVNFSNGIYNSSEKFWREHMLSRHHCYFYKQDFNVRHFASYIMYILVYIHLQNNWIFLLATFFAKFCSIISNTKKLNFKNCVIFFYNHNMY